MMPSSQNKDAEAGTGGFAMRFERIHLGLPDDAPWLVRVGLRSRGFLIVTAVFTAFVAVVAASNPGWLLQIDQPLSEWVRAGEGDLSFAKLVTQMGSPVLTIAVGIGAVAVLWRRCRASALTLGALTIAALTTDLVLKLVVERPRPPNPAVSTQLGSFPSGHVIHAVVVFGLVPLVLWTLTNSRLFLRIGFALFFFVVALVAFSRVRLGAHWPSDVVSSFFIGGSLLLAAEQTLTSG